MTTWDNTSLVLLETRGAEKERYGKCPQQPEAALADEDPVAGCCP